MADYVDVVMIRHAQSAWNAQDLFTGWADPELTEKGKEEARLAGRLLEEAGYSFDTIYTSVLRRASQTADIICDVAGKPDAVYEKDWRLNERHYGQLQGKNKIKMGEEAGKEQVHRWRRGYEDMAPALALDSPDHPKFDDKYTGVDPSRLPAVESLKLTRERAEEFWNEKVLPEIKAGKSILISSHGNTLRGLIMYLDDMTPEEIEKFEIPTGAPIIYRFDTLGRPQSWSYARAPVS